MSPDQIATISIEEELKSSFIDYSMSVIISRALPDVRDGLKPVHRRILVAMNDLNLTADKPAKKCAKICGDVSGNYHPHGEQVIYPTLVRMAQDFSMRYPLVNGQGNFGSIDGDPPAAMRYTEAKMSRITEEMLKDLDKETVDFVPNYDGSQVEPVVLPTVLPNLLINGSSGIAVGMATNIPPHNLAEVIDALVNIIEDPECTTSDLCKHIKGPDFPTGGIIYGVDGIKSAYETGRGLVKLRANAYIEEHEKSGKDSIIVDEIPYQVNKSSLLEAIANLVNNRKIEGVADIRDESDREGMRIVIELKKDGIAQVILNQLYKHTQLEITYGIIMLALVDGEPKVLTLKEMLEYFIAHRRQVVIRRSIFELQKAEARAHILEGMKKALDFIDEVINIIRSSSDGTQAKRRLIESFEFSDEQAQAILDMRLQRLTGLEREKIDQEYKELIKQISYLKSILGSESVLMGVIKEELLQLKERYQDPRKTQIAQQTEDLSAEDFIIEEDMVVMITHQGYIKRNKLSLYRAQHRGGIGVTGILTKDDDFVEHLFVASTHDYVLVFTNLGKVHWIKVYQIPEAGRAAKGKAVVNFLRLETGEHIAAYMPVRDFREDLFVTMVTKKGLVKKTELMAFSRPLSSGIIAIKIKEGDELISSRLTNGNADLFIATKLGKAVRFKEEQIRPTGRGAMGVIGIRLSNGDEVVGMEAITEPTTILTVTENGYGKRTDIEQYTPKNRGTMGVINIKTTMRNGYVVGITTVKDGDDVICITSKGKIIRLSIKPESLRTIGRNTQGVHLQDLDAGEKIVAFGKVAKD